MSSCCSCPVCARPLLPDLHKWRDTEQPIAIGVGEGTEHHFGDAGLEGGNHNAVSPAYSD